MTASRQDTFAVYPTASAPGARAARVKAPRRETWQMNCSVDASLRRDVKIAAFEAGVSQSAYLESAVVQQLIRDGWITAADARRRGLVLPAGREA